MSNDELLNSLQQMIDVAEKRMAEHSLESRHAWDLTYRSLRILEANDLTSFVSRYEEPLINLDSKMAQVVIGVRRSGKSTICEKVLREKVGDFAYVNFDDERLVSLKTDELDTLLEALYRLNGDFKYLFLDEIQNIDGWQLFVNRLLRQTAPDTSAAW